MRVAALALLAVQGVTAQSDTTYAVPDSVAEPGYTTVYVDDAESWDTVGSDGYLHARDIASPDSNLVSAPCADDAEPVRQAGDALARANRWEPDRAVDHFRVIERRCFEAEDARIGFLRARATSDDHEAMVVWVEAADIGRRYFAEANTPDETGWLRAFAFEDGEPVVYGHRAGNPNLPHGGGFRLLLLPDVRRIWFEFKEETF